MALTLPGIGAAQDLSATCLPTDAADPPAPGSPAPGSPTGPTTVTDSSGQSYSVVAVTSGEDPSGIALDATDPFGRVFVADRGSDQVTVLYGRSPELTLGCRLPVGPEPIDVAVDDATGTAMVTLGGVPRVVLIEGRAERPRITGWVDLPATPAQVVIDQEHRRAWISMPGAGRIARLEPEGSSSPDTASWLLTGTFDAGSFPTFMAVDPDRERLFVSAQGQAADAGGDLGLGFVWMFDTSGPEPTPIGEPIPASVPTGIAIDPVRGAAYVLENGTDGIMSIYLAPGQAPDTDRLPLPFVDESQNQNPVDLVLLPATRELLVTMASVVASAIGGHLDGFRVNDIGDMTYERSIPSAQRTRGIVLDPTTGRVFVTAPGEGRVAAYAIEEPTAPPPPPPTIAAAMPGPLHISLAPEDVVRTAGLSLLVLLLVGAPTPLFNETLESHVGELGGWFSRRLPRSRGPGRLDRLRAAARRLDQSIWGVAVYVAIAALILSFLAPAFPGQDALLVFGVALVGLIVANIVDALPGERYVARRYGAHGTIRVAVWTLGLAAVTVLISRMAGLQPGFMYGIIGTVTFAVALTSADEGRMEAWGALGLLLVAIAAWFARIPFEPTPGVPQSGPGLIINMGLVGIFVVAVEGLVFGLIPLRFLPGEKVFRWSRWRWLLLWGAGLALFAHVLVYPVTLAQPSPDPSTLAATLVSVGIYGLIAVLFWGVFRWREHRAGTSPGPPAT
jgi:DNA-binding beta-propeller fold protein YncE